MHKQHSLSFLDQQPHIRNFARHLTIFSFRTSHHADDAINTLRNGLAATIEKFPQLAGSICIPDPASGDLQLSYPELTDAQKEASRIFSSNFEISLNLEFDHDKLQKESFDPSSFLPEVFCPDLLKHHPGLDDGDAYATGSTSLSKGIPLPVFAAQATSIPNGLVLSVWIYHCSHDGAGARSIYEVWSKSVREQGSENLNPTKEVDYYNTTDSSHIPYQLDNLARASSPETNPKAMTILQSHTSLRNTPYKVTTRLFRFPSSTITQLGKTISSQLNTHITPFIALSSLIWAHILLTRKLSSTFTTTTLAVVVDLRSCLGHPFTSPDYLNNCVLSARTSYNIPSTIPPINTLITTLASCITSSLHHFTPPVITARLATLIRSPGIIDNQNLTFGNGPDLYITDWRSLGIDNDWGMLGKPVVIRRAAWEGEGGIVVLPRVKDGEWECMVCLEEVGMAGLEEVLRGSGQLSRNKEERAQL